MSVTQPLSTLIFAVSSGTASLVLGKKPKLPSILFLLFFGVLLGPGFANYVNPVIFRHNFPHYISLTAALILFEGAGSLRIQHPDRVIPKDREIIYLDQKCESYKAGESVNV